MTDTQAETIKRLVSLTDIKGSLAYWVCRQHAYNLVDHVNEANFKLECAVGVSTEWDKLGNLNTKYFDSFEQIEKFIKSVLQDGPEFRAWNTPAKDSGAKFLFVSAYCAVDAQHDFIDISALTGNIARQVWNDCAEYTC